MGTIAVAASINVCVFVKGFGDCLLRGRGGPSATATVGDDDGESKAELVSDAEDVALTELRDMIRSHLTLQQDRERRMQQEAVRQEARWKAM
ncbi:hypothetical protein IRJ41_002030 [Triplophysa rosa]|uniref:Uncharacterized protein n=1 Tax=Triplophysa rosa TaxID=992332 RepID=A0A9W7WV44_TRIRA|nr:hypothetical protein IRJ41_002030 [Triplophysa rosa]